MKRLLIRLIKFYQQYISPIKGPSCRFYPSCSTYGIEAINRFGAIKGTLLTVVRISKCHPFHPGGVDYVPPKQTKNKQQIKNKGDDISEAENQ